MSSGAASRATLRCARGYRALLLVALLTGCREPTSPPPPDHDLHGVYVPNPPSLEFHAGADRSSPLRLEATQVSFDSRTGTVHARVAFWNPRSGGPPVPGQDGVLVSSFAPAGVAPTNATAFPCNAPACPSWIFDHRDSFGAGGTLLAGGASQPVEWIFTDPGNQAFSFRAGFDSITTPRSGEISGSVFEDRNWNGTRDGDEPGIENVEVSLVGPSARLTTRTDPTGRFAFEIHAAGAYTLQKEVFLGCCSTTPEPLDIPIEGHADGSLSGFARADFGCSATSQPEVRLVEVRARRADLAPCSTAEPCTIPAMTSFKVRFTGVSHCRGIRGLQWQAVFPDGRSERFQPFGTDSLFLGVRRDTVALYDGSATGGGIDTLWALRRDTVTVFYASRSTPPFQPIDTGVVLFRARVTDDSGRRSTLSTHRIIVNYPPQTWMYRGDSCSPGGPGPSGWITGIGAVEFPIDSWIPFCPGDTIPNESHVRVYARGRDDPRDEPADPQTGLGEPRLFFGYMRPLRRYDWDSAPTYPTRTLPLPRGGAWRGAAVSWQVCPFDYTLRASAVDERGTFDSTPDSIEFNVSGAPTLDSLYAPKIIVFVPQCAPGVPFCDSVPAFGPDTLAILGKWIPAPSGSTPLNLGLNEFEFPFRAWGHDHPRDRNSPGRVYHDRQNDGRIRSWNVRFNCVPDRCDSYFPPGAADWTQDVPSSTDPPGEQVWDPVWRYAVALDTLCTTWPCSLSGVHVKLVIGALGEYLLTVQGRDTDAQGQFCAEPINLGPDAPVYPRGIADLGRTTGILSGRVFWRQFADVRPPRRPRAATPAWSRRVSPLLR